MRHITAFFMTWGNFSILPCPYKKWDSDLKNLMLVFLPILGGIIGIIWYALWWVFNWAGLPIPLMAALLTVYPFFISGFMHLDGFMDCSDAILSRKPVEEKQKILKDSHVGAFSVISIVMLFLLFFAAMWSLPADNHTMLALIFIPMISRSASAVAVLAYEPLDHSQYKQGFDRKRNAKNIFMVTLISLLVIAASIGLFIISHMILVGVLSAAIVAQLACRYARKQLGGMSGDISGYALTLSELAGIMMIAIMGGNTWF